MRPALCCLGAHVLPCCSACGRRAQLWCGSTLQSRPSVGFRALPRPFHREPHQVMPSCVALGQLASRIACDDLADLVCASQHGIWLSHGEAQSHVGTSERTGLPSPRSISSDAHSVTLHPASLMKHKAAMFTSCRCGMSPAMLVSIISIQAQDTM